MDKISPYKSKRNYQSSKRKNWISNIVKKKQETINMNSPSENNIDYISCNIGKTVEAKEPEGGVNINGNYLNNVNNENQNRNNLEGFLNDKKIREEIIKTKLTEKESIKIIATAGSGKSTTLREIAKFNSTKEYYFLAFNKKTQEEKEKEFRDEGIQNVEVRTLHSVAFDATAEFHKRKEINSNIIIDSKLFENSFKIKQTLSKFFISKEDKITKSHYPKPHLCKQNDDQTVIEKVIKDATLIWED